MPPLPVFISCESKSLFMDMSFERHTSFDLGKDQSDAKSSQRLDYARLIALSQKTQARRDLEDSLGLTNDAQTKTHKTASDDVEIEERIALISGAGRQPNGGTRSTNGRGAFLKHGKAVGCGPDEQDTNAKSKLAVYPDHLGSGKASDVRQSGEQDKS